MTDTELINAAVAASAGALVSGTLGWWDSHEPFNARKFMGSVWRAVFAGMGWLAVNQFADVQGVIWLWAFLGGAGIEVLGNRIQGGFTGKSETVKIQEQLELLERKIADLVQTRTERSPNA